MFQAKHKGKLPKNGLKRFVNDKSNKGKASIISRDSEKKKKKEENFLLAKCVKEYITLRKTVGLRESHKSNADITKRWVT